MCRGERGHGGGVGAVPRGGELLHAARAAEHRAHIDVRGQLVEQRAELDQLAWLGLGLGVGLGLGLGLG